MSKLATIFYAILVYLMFLVIFAYLVAFVAGAPFIPLSVDRGAEASVLVAVAVNLALIAQFGLQHSIMARPWFKRIWTRIVPAQAERSTFMLFTNISLIALFLLWKPIEQIVWELHSPVAHAIIWTIFGLGWAVVLLSTFLINHFEMFGLQQAYHYARGRAAAAPRLREPFLYRYVRHPLYLGFIVAFWAVPRMTLGHLLLAAGMSVYMLIAIRYEERDLITFFGRDYESYRRRVGMLMPRFRRPT